MNIFAIYNDPKESARHLCDQHVVKMIIESGQLLANAFTLERLNKDDCPKTKKNESRRHSHLHHPSSKWTLSSRKNYEWVLEHALELVKEKSERYPKSPIHFTNDFLIWVSDHIDELQFQRQDLEDFSVAISEDKICRNDPKFSSSDSVGKYRLYYIYDKQFATWKRNKPSWIN